VQGIDFADKNKSVIVGCTHRVIWCDCPKNVTFKTFDEWCEWCKCESCGGKNGTFMNNQKNNMSINVDAIVSLVIYFLAAMLLYYGRLQLYMILYSISCASTLLFVRIMYNKHEFKLSQ